MADCIVKIVGKNGMSGSFTLSGISQSSGIQEIINALSESELREIESFVEDPGTKRKSIELNDSQSEYARQVIGNYNANSIESKLKQDNKSFKGFSQYTKSLLNAVKQMMGDVDFILFSNLDYSSSNAASDIQGAVLRYSRENPLLLIKGEDPDAIENTLRHELTHLFFNRLIESDKSLQESINKMYREISKRAKNLDDNPEIRDFITTIDILDLLNEKEYVPTEIFAYLFQDENSYKYIKDNFLDVWNQFNDLIELREPVGKIKNDINVPVATSVQTEANENIFNKYKRPEAKIDVTFTQEQQQVIDEVNDFIENGDPDKFYVISGKAGTGKTTVAQAIALAFPNHSIIAGAFTHQATSVIGGKFKDANLRNVESYTLASMLGLRKDEKSDDFKIDDKAAAKAPIKRAQIIIIDEASMIHEEHLEQIMKNKPENAKVIFLGDVGQLRPVRPDKLRRRIGDKKSPIFDSIDEDNISKLHTRIRQGEESPILPFADYYWNESQHIEQPEEVENLNNNRETKITDKGALIFVNTPNSIYKQMLDLFKEGILNNNPNKIRYITYTNEDRESVNKDVRAYIFGKEAPKYVKHELITFTDSLMSGNTVVIPNSTNAQIIEEPRSTTQHIVVQNNQTVEIRSIELTIKMGDYIETINVVDPRDSAKYAKHMASYKEYMNSHNRWKTREYGDYLAAQNHFAKIDYGYAITSHKSQGSTFDVAIINEKNIMGVSATSDEVKAESIYTSLTRPKNVAVVISEKTVNVDSIPDIKDLNDGIENNKAKQSISIQSSNKAEHSLKTAFSEQPEQPDFFEHSNEIPFQILEETQDFEKMMPHLKWDSEEKTFENINDAYEFFESYKNDDVGLANVWSQAEEVTNITQIANAKAGDILRISSLEYLPVPKNGEVGLFGPAEWYGKMIPRKEMIRRIDQNLYDLGAYRQKLEEDIKNRNNRTTDPRYIIPELTDKLFNSIVDKQIKAKSKYYKYDSKTKTWGDLTEDGQKYLNLQPNYILARVFYDNKNNVYKGYVAIKFKNSDEASCMLIDLDPSYVQSIRRMDDSFRQEYEYKDGELVTDSNGNPKIKKKSARYDISKVSDEDIEAAQAGLVALNNIVDELDVEIEDVKESPKLLEKYTFKNGNSIYKASKHGILISGFFGDLGDALKEASVGDYVKVLESRNKDKSTKMTWATKVMDLPGGILVMMPSGKYKVVNENNATAVVFSKENLNKYLEDVVEIVDETKQMSRQKRLFSSSNNSKDFSIYPFWAESDASKRADLAKTLKKGDYVKIMFQGKEPNPIEFVAPILFVTQTKIYYGTSNGEIASVDLESYTEGKWVKEDNKWTFTGKVTKSFIRAAYVDHRKHKDALNYFTEYLESANELRELPWTKEDHEYVTLDNLTDQLLGVIDNPHSNLQKTSISSEWAITEFEDSDINTKVRKVSNLIVGDLVKVAYEHTNTNNTTETRYKWGMVVGKDGKTNEPITAIYGKGGKVIVRRQSYDRIHSVGERSLPIYLNKETGKYSNYQKEGFEEISKGRPNNLNKLREKYSEFFETGLKLVNVSKEELDDMRKKLNRNFGKKWDAVKMTYVEIDGGDKTWVMDFDQEKHTKIETNEVKYRIVANTFSDKQYSIRQYQINKSTAKLYNSYKATFDQIKSVVTLGDVITYEVTTSKGNKMYVPGIVTEITNSAIQISAVRVETNENTGDRLYSNDTYTWFKNSKNQNIKVTEFYGSNYNDIYDLGNKLSSKNNKSLDTNKFKKSYDNRETISLMSERLQKLYGVNTILLNNEEMIEKGRELNSDFSNVRGFAIGSKNEIYINIDKASIAEPLHELSHLLMPGLKSKNPKAYNVMMDKVKDHPSYSDIAENYPELTGRDLDEEIFVTIFAEYFREKMLSEEKNEWLSGEFFELADNVPSVTSNLFDNNVDADSNDLMNMTLEDIMNNFGSAMVTGRLQPLIHTSINLNGSTDVQKIYKSLIDKGKLKKIC